MRRRAVSCVLRTAKWRKSHFSCRKSFECSSECEKTQSAVGLVESWKNPRLTFRCPSIKRLCNSVIQRISLRKKNSFFLPNAIFLNYSLSLSSFCTPPPRDPDCTIRRTPRRLHGNGSVLSEDSEVFALVRNYTFRSTTNPRASRAQNTLKTPSKRLQNTFQNTFKTPSNAFKRLQNTFQTPSKRL